MAKSSEVQRKWALVGAEARLKEVQAEIAEIYSVFPELKPGRTVAAASAKAPARQFSPEGKAAISEGMRKYWARRKAAAAAKTTRAGGKN